MNRINIAIITDPPEAGQTAVQYVLEDIIKLRPHLKKPNAYWDDSAKRIVVSVDSDISDKAIAEKAVADEIWDEASAVLDEVNSCKIEIIKN